MPEAAGSKYGIIEDGLPTVEIPVKIRFHRSVWQHLTEISSSCSITPASRECGGNVVWLYDNKLIGCTCHTTYEGIKNFIQDVLNEMSCQ